MSKKHSRLVNFSAAEEMFGGLEKLKELLAKAGTVIRRNARQVKNDAFSNDLEEWGLSEEEEDEMNFKVKLLVDKWRSNPSFRDSLEKEWHDRAGKILMEDEPTVDEIVKAKVYLLTLEKVASESAQGTATAKAGNTTAPTASTHQKARQELSEEEKDKLLRGHRKKLEMLVRRGIMKADYSCADGVEKELYAFCVGVLWCGDKIIKGSITISTTALPRGLKELLRFKHLSQYRSRLQGKKKGKNYTQIFRELNY